MKLLITKCDAYTIKSLHEVYSEITIKRRRKLIFIFEMINMSLVLFASYNLPSSWFLLFFEQRMSKFMQKVYIISMISSKLYVYTWSASHIMSLISLLTISVFVFLIAYQIFRQSISASPQCIHQFNQSVRNIILFWMCTTHWTAISLHYMAINFDRYV